MEEIFNKKLTIDDIKKINELKPEYISISSTKLIDYQLLAELDKSIQIRIVNEKEEKSEPESYSVEEMISLIDYYGQVENGIQADWSDLDKSLYVYVKLMTQFNLVEDNQRAEKTSSLKLGLTHNEDSKGLARHFGEILDRVGIQNRIVENVEGTHAWNDVMIDGRYRPTDISLDYKRTLENPGMILVENFGKNPEFYDYEEHKLETKQEVELLPRESVQASLEKVVSNLESERIAELENQIQTAERKNVSIKVQSKEISGLFENDVITLDTLKEIKPLKINVTDGNFTELIDELGKISEYYPEIMDNIEIENTSGSHVDIQPILDSICEGRKEKFGFHLDPINLTISSDHEEDFDIDLSALQRSTPNSTRPVDENSKQQKISFRNTGSTPMKLPNPTKNLPKDVDVISFENFDLDNVDISSTSATTIELVGGSTVNICNVTGIMSIPRIFVSGISDSEFDQLMSVILPGNPNLFSLHVSNQRNLAGRNLLEEIATQNPNMVDISVANSNLNSITGLESLDGRLAKLYIANTDISSTDVEHLVEFVSRPQNKRVDYNFSKNRNYRNKISSSTQISQESYDRIRDWFYYNGLTQRLGNNVVNKLEAIDLLLDGHMTVPYYIKDAEVIRNQLNLKEVPMILENDDEVSTVDFTAPHLQDANLLLTIPQLNRLISEGRTIPLNVRVMIQDVTELDSTTLTNLESQMSAMGNRLTGVQIIEKDNKNTQIEPYSISEYTYIRDTLDSIVADIDPSEPEIDKFATVYTRLANSIVYDNDIIDSGDRNNVLHAAECRNSSRNLLEGLTDGRCVCAGYADILRNALKLVGVEARINSGIVTGAGGERGGHAWNQVRIDGKWYFTDLTWDRQKDKPPARRGRFDECLKGTSFRNNHQVLETINPENVETADYDRVALRAALNRAKTRSFDFRDKIVIPEDPPVDINIDDARISAEYIRRKDDMYAKFYGDRGYQREYEERNARYREHEIERTDRSITYRTVEDYPEREEDERFLLLDRYQEALERMTRYEAGDTSVYSGTPDAVTAALERDREYVTTRNHTFDQHRHTQRDLATLGKYGERVPYIPPQPGVLRNIGRGVLNVGIFGRNLVAPVYRVIGRFVAQPIHRLVTRGKDASPYRNNWYHRMVARRDYFEDKNSAEHPGQPIRNNIRSRVNAIFSSREGNEAVLRAGAADIRENIVEQERERALLENLQNRKDAFDQQIRDLQEQARLKPSAANIAAVNQAIADKTTARARVEGLINLYENGQTGTTQTDAVSEKQHAIASKEVNTIRTTVIKGVVKGVAARYVGPKIHEWLAERGKRVVPRDITTEVQEERERWIPATYKEEKVPVYQDVPTTKTDGSITEMMNANSGKEVTGFYSVYGGERGAASYTLTGNEKITAIFEAQGNGGTGLSDIAGLKAPTLTDGTFTSSLLDANGVLRQDVTLDQLLEAMNNGTVDPSKIGDMYVSVGDRYWTKLSDLVGTTTEKVQIGEDIRRVVDVAGHYEKYMETVQKVVHTTEVITDPDLERIVEVGSDIVRGAVVADTVVDVAENVRNTTSNIRSNKRRPRNYTFDEDLDDIPTSKRDYDER